MQVKYVDVIPKCYFCLMAGANVEAVYEGNTSLNSPAGGRVSPMCADCRKLYGPMFSFSLSKVARRASVFLLLFAFWMPVAHADMAMVAIARTQIGLGEIGGNNRGPIVEKYTKGQDVAWCASFVSWVRFRAGQQHNYLLAARSYWTIYARQRVALPRAGDLIIFSRGSHQGHIGIVERVQGQDITTIEGNVGAYPARVKEFHYRLGHIKSLLGFVRI